MDITINNGYVDMVRFSAIESYIKKILKLKKKYNYSKDKINIDNNVDIEFDDKNGTCYILIDENRIVKYSYHHSFNQTKIMLTVGLHNNVVHFVTKDKKYRNKQTIEMLGIKLKNSIPQVKKEFCEQNDKSKFGILYNVYRQINSIENLREKYDMKPNENEDLTIKINDKISLVYTDKNFLKLFKVRLYSCCWYVYVNDNPVIQCSSSSIETTTDNQEVNTKEYIDKISKAITNNMEKIENYFTDFSKKKFGL